MPEKGSVGRGRGKERGKGGAEFSLKYFRSKCKGTEERRTTCSAGEKKTRPGKGGKGTLKVSRRKIGRKNFTSAQKFWTERENDGVEIFLVGLDS